MAVSRNIPRAKSMRLGWQQHQHGDGDQQQVFHWESHGRRTVNE